MGVYEIVTDRIVSLLEKGTVPWRRPWDGGCQQNLITEHVYTGFNAVLTGSAGFKSPYWLTFKQAHEHGGSIKRGEHGFPCLFWKEFNKDAEEEPAQVDTIEFNSIAAAESIVSGYPARPEIKDGGGQASYSPAKDCVRIPAKETFRSASAFYSTLFHELVHSTGQQSRLDRFQEGNIHFGSEEYSKEELIAEIGASFLNSQAGIVDSEIENSAAYISGWLTNLRKDSKLIISAAGKAQKTVDWINGKSSSTEPA